MNAKTLIKFLQDHVKPVDRENSDVEVWMGEQEFEIVGLSWFDLSPNIVIKIKKVKSPFLRPARIKAEHKKTFNEIKKKILKNRK